MGIEESRKHHLKLDILDSNEIIGSGEIDFHSTFFG